MEYLTGERVLELMDEVIAEMGEDFVYQQIDGHCLYIDGGGNPSCLVGRILAKSGFDVSRLAHPYNNTATVWEISQRMNLMLADGDAFHILRRAQAEQDSGVPWGEVRKRAATRLLTPIAH